MSAIKTVIFDLGGVYFTDGPKAFQKIMTDRFGVTKEKVFEVIGGDLGNAYRMGTLSPEKFWEQAKAAWGVDMDTKELSLLWIEEYNVIPGTVDIINRLRAAKYELLFLSDNAPDRVEYLNAKYGFMEKFEDGVFSHHVRVRKPDPKIYDAALGLTESPADQCVYIDDKEKNLIPAQEMGMKGIAFTSPEQLEQDLKALGMQF